MSEGFTVEEILGRNVADLRREHAWSQDRLGAELRPFLGKPLTRKAVSVLENGGRRLGAEEIVALALVLGASVAGLFVARPGEEIRFRTSAVRPARDMLGPGAGAGRLTDEELARLYTLSGIASTARAARDEIRNARLSLEAADRWAVALEEIHEEEAARGKEER